MANASFASFTTLYLSGLRVNMAEHGITALHKRLFWYAAQIALLPVFTAMEAGGVALALIRPVSGFHVVKK